MSKEELPGVPDRFCETSSASSPKSVPAPFSIRFSREERDELERRAGTKPLGTFIRESLLGDLAVGRRSYRKPRIDDEKAAALLAVFGQSRIPANINQLAKRANAGTLDISDETERLLQEAAMAVLAMREALLTALGLKS